MKTASLARTRVAFNTELIYIVLYPFVFSILININSLVFDPVKLEYKQAMMKSAVLHCNVARARKPDSEIMCSSRHSQ